jgi:hypothetical protein
MFGTIFFAVLIFIVFTAAMGMVLVGGLGCLFSLFRYWWLWLIVLVLFAIVGNH